MFTDHESEWEYRHMPSSEDKIILPEYFDTNPELKARFVAYLQSLSPEERAHNAELYKKFVTGEMTWAEVKKIPKSLLKELAQAAYLKLKTRDFAKAEVLFQGLAIIDHHNWYYRAGLGTVYQKQNRFAEAIAEFSKALDIKSDELTCLVNRGECYLRMGKTNEAKQDLQEALRLSFTPVQAPWKKRAEVLLQAIV